MTLDEIIKFFDDIIFPKNGKWTDIECFKIHLPNSILVKGYTERMRFSKYSTIMEDNQNKIWTVNYKRSTRDNHALLYECIKNSFEDHIPIKIEFSTYWYKTDSIYTIRYTDTGADVQRTNHMRLNDHEKKAIQLIKFIDNI